MLNFVSIFYCFFYTLIKNLNFKGFEFFILILNGQKLRFIKDVQQIIK